MPARRKSRQRALQVLYLWDARKLTIDEALEIYRLNLYAAESEEDTGDEEATEALPDGFMEELARGTVAHQAELDELILKKAENWRIERMPIVDRNILRMALFEMKHLQGPAPVVIDEALELARRYSGDETVPFINGVLDALRKLLAEPPSEA